MKKMKTIILKIVLILLTIASISFTVFGILELLSQQPVKASNSGNTSEIGRAHV